MDWLQDYAWVLAAVLAVVGLARWTTRRLRLATPGPGAAARRQVDLTFTAAVLVTLAVGWWAVVWLVEQADQVTDEKAKATAKADAIRTGATIALGTGGAAYLLLAYRRQRLEEVDTRERRITELFTKAVEQLGHEKAPVRLGALYSLERLAQDNPEHRQTIVDVVCAYLRMPYSLPARNDPGAAQVEEEARFLEDGDQARDASSRQDLAQELQVRQTAQRILAAHLQGPPGISSTAQRRRPSPGWWGFWPGISLDLRGAVLVDLDFAGVSVVQARFDRASFQGERTILYSATFQDDARFDEATFECHVRFEEVTFGRLAWFRHSTFEAEAWFDRATFHDDAGFHNTTFQGNVRFSDATFQAKAEFGSASFQLARFGQVSFQGNADFSGAIFQGQAWFAEATFQSKAYFSPVTFQGDAAFHETTFQGDALFGDATFQGSASFSKATFQSRTVFETERVLHVDNPDLHKRRAWPDGYIVRLDPADPTRGMLVRAQHERVRAGQPPSDRPAHN